MRAQGITASCSNLWAQGAAAVIGISPFNSYFDEPRIRSLIEFCRRGGRHVTLFVPDEVTRYTLEARGYAPDKAARKTRRQIQYLRNKIARAGGAAPPPVLGCAELESSPAYRQRHAELERRFATDPAFSRGCLDTTRWVLMASPGETVSDAAALLGVRYLLAELPLFLHAPEITGGQDAVFVYPQGPRFVHDLYRGRYGDAVSAGQGFVELVA